MNNILIIVIFVCCIRRHINYPYLFFAALIRHIFLVESEEPRIAHRVEIGSELPLIASATVRVSRIEQPTGIAITMIIVIQIMRI